MSSGNTSSQRVAKALELNAKEDKQPEPLLIFIVFIASTTFKNLI